MLTVLFILLSLINLNNTRNLPEDNVVWILAHKWRDFDTTINLLSYKEHPIILLNEYYKKGYQIVGHSITKDYDYSWTLEKLK
jgi:hypothetical protein